jgi:heat shock protein HslJ
MKMLFRAATAALLITAGAAHAQDNAEPYRARGTEPFWSATIDSQSLRFDSAEGRPLIVAKPRPIVGINGERYVTPQLTIDVTHVPCSDGMSDRQHHDRVVVNAYGREWRGCGGDGAPVRTSAIEGSWRVVSINGRPTLGAIPATIRFEGERVSGNTGCNAFGGNFRFGSGRLRVGPLMSTRRACFAPALNGQERTLLAFFAHRASVSQGTRGRLVLSGRDGATLVLAPDPGRR